jgi:hypothetical protein
METIYKGSDQCIGYREPLDNDYVDLTIYNNLFFIIRDRDGNEVKYSYNTTDGFKAVEKPTTKLVNIWLLTADLAPLSVGVITLWVKEVVEADAKTVFTTDLFTLKESPYA